MMRERTPPLPYGVEVRCAQVDFAQHLHATDDSRHVGKFVLKLEAVAAIVGLVLVVALVAMAKDFGHRPRDGDRKCMRTCGRTRKGPRRGRRRTGLQTTGPGRRLALAVRIQRQMGGPLFLSEG